MNPSDLSAEQLEQIINRVATRVMQRAGAAAAPVSAVPLSAAPAGGSTAAGQGPASAVPFVATVPTGAAGAQCVADALSGGACRIAPDNLPANCRDVAQYIDHTLLKPDARVAEIENLCREALEFKFASVCVNPTHVELCAQLLAGSGVKVCTVIGFPLGAMTKEAKAFETRDALAKGADEIDMVINVGQLKSMNYQVVLDDIQAVRRACPNKILKVILETCLLSDEEIKIGSILSKAAGADFVKTSTGFSKGGATKEDVALMRASVGPLMGVKASGGVRDCAAAQEMIKSGATRLGASASVQIVQGKSGAGNY